MNAPPAGDEPPSDRREGAISRSVRRIVPLAAAVLLATPLQAAAAPTPAACDPGWNVTPSPEPDPEVENGLSSVTAITKSDVWAVGASGTYGGTRDTLAMHWDGGRWDIAPTPNGVNEVNWLTAADAVGTNNVWAVGFSQTNPPESALSKTLIEHWNGTSWSTTPSPNPTPPLSGGPHSSELYGVDAVSANDVWAVGLTHDYGAGRTLIIHWNGTKWSVVPSPSPGLYGWLRSVSAVSANDVWAAGTHYVNNSQVTLILHWNGTAWSVVPSANDGPFVQELFGIDAVSADDVWAVGYHLAVFGVNQVFQTSVFHWDGSAWSVVPSPDQSQFNNYLWSVDGTSATDAWAVGFWDTGFELRTMTQHWDGAEWTVVDSPNDSDYIDELHDVDALTAQNTWAVGMTTGPFSFHTLAMRRGACSPAMFVTNIVPSYNATTEVVSAKVTVKSGVGVALEGAKVTVRIRKPSGASFLQTRTTNGFGRATFTVDRQADGTYTFTVTGVSKDGFAYDPALNAETSDSITVP